MNLLVYDIMVIYLFIMVIYLFIMVIYPLIMVIYMDDMDYVYDIITDWWLTWLTYPSEK